MPFAHIEANAGNSELIVDFRRHAIDDGLSRSVVCAGGIAQRLQDVLFSLSRVVGSQVDARQGVEGGGSLVGIAQLLVDADATRGIPSAAGKSASRTPIMASRLRQSPLAALS